MNVSSDITSPEDSADQGSADQDFVLGNSHGHKPRTRKDIASGDIMNPVRMIRLAFSQDGEVVADVFAKIPGRGAWIAANRDAVKKAIKTKAISRAAKRDINVPETFADIIEQQLSRKVLGLIGMANRAGELESGFDKVRGAAQAGKIAFRIEALDGAQDGRSKIRVISKAIAREMQQTSAPVIGCYTSAQLGSMLGREHMVHLALRKGRLTQSLRAELSRLAGFCSLIPQTWPDKDHEEPFVPFS